MYSTYNEEESVFAERFIRVLKNKIYQHMTDGLENVYFDVLDDIVDKYDNTYHNTTKMKHIDVKSNFYAEYNVYFNDKDPKFKIGDHVWISNYKNIFTKEYAPNWSEEVFAISKIKNAVPWTYVIMDLNDEKNIETFYEKELQ